MKSIILTIIMLMVLACGGSDSENNPMPTPIPTPTPTPEPEGYSDTVKNLFYELCLPAANDEFCECSVNQIEENIPVDEFPVEDLMGRILSGEISDETSNSDIANLFPESVLEAVSPCFDLILDSDSVIEIEETELIPDIEAENLELMTEEELLEPLMEICSSNQSGDFCECTVETILDNYSKEDLVNLRASLSDGELPSDIFQLGLMNCAIYLGQ
ncbi:MAG: hypothetical protein VXU44_02555 [Chloroflexota bacterium]|nr:hypothetical protein [Chloroflexota bacterium]